MRRTSRLALVLTTAAALTTTACGGGGFNNSGSSSTASQKSGPAKLTMMIGSSGDAETNAVKDATAAWGKKTGNTVEVVAASNLAQQLGQAFTGGNPPDVFYGAGDC